jgi:hypothetical protein
MLIFSSGIYAAGINELFRRSAAEMSEISRPTGNIPIKRDGPDSSDSLNNK